MRHNASNKPANEWNPFFLALYEALPFPLNEAIWLMEKHRYNPDANGLLLPTEEDEDYTESFNL